MKPVDKDTMHFHRIQKVSQVMLMLGEYRCHLDSDWHRTAKVLRECQELSLASLREAVMIFHTTQLERQ